MRKLALALAFGSCATTAFAAPACKDWNDTPNWISGHLVSYAFAIDPQDRVSSKGAWLDAPMAVVQQDRANMHKFGRPGPLDQFDALFGALDRRQLIAKADLRTACYMTRVELERIMMDPSMMQFYQADVFVEGNRLVIFVSVVAG